MQKPKDNGPLHRKVMGHLGDAAKLVTQGRPPDEVEEVLGLVKEFADQHVSTLKPEEKVQYELTLQLKLREVRDSLLSRERFSRLDMGVDRKDLFRKYSSVEFPKHIAHFLKSVKINGSFSALRHQGAGDGFLSYMDFAGSREPSGRNHFLEIAEPKRMFFVFCAFYRAYLSRVLSLVWTKREKVLIAQVLDPVLVVTGFLETSQEIVSPHKILAEEVTSSHGWKQDELEVIFKEFASFMVADCKDFVEQQSLDSSLTWDRFVDVALSDNLLKSGKTGEILHAAFRKALGKQAA